MPKDLTILLVTFNSSQIIHQSLSRISSETQNSKWDIVVVDNASSDNTAKIVSENFPKVKLIKTEKNIGYGRANNIALREIKTDFVLLLNADALIEENTIDKIISLLKTNPQIAISGPFVYSKKSFADDAASEVCTHIKKKSNYSEDENFFYGQFITGAAMFLNMEIMRKVGFFDEEFFLYGEDNEICKRVVRKGYKTAIVKDTKFYHLSGQSSVLNDEQIARVCWHKYGWSKLYYTKAMWGGLVARLKAIRMIVKLSVLILKEWIKNRKISVVNKSAMKGCCAFFIGMGAFDRDGNPRG